MNAEVIRLNPNKKTCTMCGLDKYLDEFFTEKGNKTDGKRGRCKLCDTASRKKYVDMNRDRMRLRDREKYANLSAQEKEILINKKAEQNKRRLQYKPEVRKAYNESDRGIFIRYRNEASRRYRSYVFDLTFEDFKKLINAACRYCGQPNCRGVDRVNNADGYTRKNSAPCCGRCNEMKNSDSVKDWLDKMERVLRHMGRIE